MRPFLRRLLCLWKTLALAAIAGTFWLTPIAHAGLFVWVQTSTPVPGISFAGSMLINGGLGDLPTVDSFDDPISFGNLLAFELHGTGNLTFYHFSLSDFTPTCVIPEPIPCIPGLPQWSISPAGIFWNSFETTLILTGFDPVSVIQVSSDAPTPCHDVDACTTTGRWVPVPEPPAVGLFCLGLAIFVIAQSFGLNAWRPSGVAARAVWRRVA